jgi:hypothetical protein
MSTSDFVTMQQKRGLKANLPASAPEGQLIVTTDTNEIFVGTGTGVAQLGGGAPAHQTTYTVFEDNAGVYADAMPGVYDSQARDGWYFTNAVVGQKINWYYYDPSILTTTVGQFQNTYAVVTIDTNRAPYFGLYTIGDTYGWYRSKRMYAVQTPSTVTPGKYLIYTGTEPTVYPELSRIQLTETTSLSQGAFASNEVILSITLQTELGSDAGNYKFVTHQLGFNTATAERELNLKIKGDTTRTFTQSTASTLWTINHNLGKHPSITIVDNTGEVVDGRIQYTNANQVICEFSPALAGKAYIN